MSDIPSVQKSLRDLCQRSVSHRIFLPNGDLATVLREEVIHSLLSKGPKLDPKRLDQKAKEVFTKAQKVFATLILIGSDEELEKFLDRKLYDDKLPFNKDDLGSCLSNRWVDEFLYEQYIFLAPVFYRGAILGPIDSRSILPFLQEESIAEGAFGVVYKIQIHAKHQRLRASQNGEYKAEWLARKEFKLLPGHREVFEREKKILEQLKHPNILPLLVTYTYGNHFNMVFPLAAMTLHDYLRIGGGYCGDYRATISLFRKVYCLIDALHYIHNFAYTENGKRLELKGYHYDLKPKNILVMGEKFMIADFSLANLKNVDQPSGTLMREGTGAYSPPEAKNEVVGRAYDIWSFGCILSEIVTFAIQGAEGVEGFAHRRTTKVTKTVENDYFHDGTNVKPEVLQHFQNLKSVVISQPPLSSIIPSILELVKQMLGPVDQRPKSKEVLERLGKMLSDHSSPVALKVDTSESFPYHPTEGPTASRLSLSASSSSAPSSSSPLLSISSATTSSYSSIPIPSVPDRDLETGFQRKLTDLEDDDSNTTMYMAGSAPVINNWIILLLLIFLLFFALRVLVDYKNAVHNEQ